MQSLKRDNWEDLDRVHQKFCPQIRIASNVVCHTECVFSCVEGDLELMTEVLRTLEVVNESSK